MYIKRNYLDKKLSTINTIYVIWMHLVSCGQKRSQHQHMHMEYWHVTMTAIIIIRCMCFLWLWKTSIHILQQKTCFLIYNYNPKYEWRIKRMSNFVLFCLVFSFLRSNIAIPHVGVIIIHKPTPITSELWNPYFKPWFQIPIVVNHGCSFNLLLADIWVIPKPQYMPWSL